MGYKSVCTNVTGASVVQLRVTWGAWCGIQMWPMVNGVAMANPGKIAWCLGSDGAQQEGNDSEAARLAAARSLNVKLVIDDNNVTIAGHPADYLKGYNVEKTLEV